MSGRIEQQVDAVRPNHPRRLLVVERMQVPKRIGREADALPPRAGVRRSERIGGDREARAVEQLEQRQEQIRVQVLAEIRRQHADADAAARARGGRG
jgi:hypothetical protein